MCRCVFAVACWLLLLTASGSSWAGDPTIPDQQREFFEKRIRPLLVTHCYECHAGDQDSGGLRLDSRDSIAQGGDSGNPLVVGDTGVTLLIEAVRYQNQDLQMPPSGPLSKQEVADLQRWVEMGAPDPRRASDAGTATDSAEPGPSGMSIAEGRQFWSLQRVSDPSLPDVDNPKWVRTPIDAFVLSHLENVGLQPAPPADRRTLIRRVTFDLIGLPPTPQEIEAFVQDDSPDAYHQLVERLLASPQYGVRWGRHWLDVARYADSNGLDENLAFGNAWRYRDYVVDAFNDDKPFDRFLIEQIAGDLVPGANRQTKTATGFLALGAKVLAEPDREKLQMDAIDEQLDAMGKAFLGMTFGCVRCHDHKFDPIKQSDYYSLAAILKSTRTFADTKTGAIKHWFEHSFATELQTAQLKIVDAEIAAKKKAATSFKNAAIVELRGVARANAAEYLVACTQFDTSASLNHVAEIAEPLGLHPRILHHCRLHLEYHRSDPLFGKWHELANSGEAVGQYFHPLFTSAESALAAARNEKPGAKKLDDPDLEIARAALYDLSGFLAVPAKAEFALNAEQLAKYYDLMEQARVIESNAPDEDSAMGVCDDAVEDQLPIHIRGSHRNFGKLVAREFPEVMRASTARSVFPTNQSGRLQLARWMASTQHPLTARVYANRIWAWHFGRGIVATTENFGALGDRPSHPDLLDYLARYLMESGWSTKSLHRLILASNTYRMSATGFVTNGTEVDPQNRLLWKFPLQRLDAEQIRDAMLAVAGRLDQSMDGKTIPLRNRQFVFNHTSVDHTKYDSLRRAIYLPVVRNNLYSLFTQFDFPDPTMPTGTRGATVVAPQALLMLNADLVMDSADQLADQLMRQVSQDRARVDLAYNIALGRRATETEKERAVAFVDDLTSRALTGSASIDPIEEHRAWSLLCQSLFASNEFIYLR
ncbi:MAG: DUF1549 domain-containing protein [Pirellulaceae bacterium]|nr:DUF1549 domain-containing protein [Pirellulaceae bacterium]